MIPFVILTGFLGSGKTTLLNRLLADRRAAGATSKIGLIVNELGQVGVDGELLPQSASRQIELPGGCVCCVLSDDLATTVVELIEGTPGLEAIVLETTGVAEPLPLAWALERPPLVDRVRLAAVITLVDALGFISSRPLSPAVDAQVAYADVLLLTKGELASETERRAVAEAAAELAPRAELRSGGTAEHATWLAALLEDPPLDHPFDPPAAPRDPPHEHHHEHHHGHGADCDGCDAPAAGGEHRHSHHRWGSVGQVPSSAHLLDTASALLPDVVVDLEELEDRLADLPSSYVRIKGIVRAVDGRRANPEVAWYAFHRVGLRVSSEPLGRPSSARVVALGRGVTIDPVKACIESALVS